MKRAFHVLVIALLALFPFGNPVFAMGSSSYQINWDDLGNGGGEDGSSASYQIHDSIGGQGAGAGSSASYQLQAGYRAVDNGTALSLQIAGQNNSSEVSYSSFSNGGKTVTVASVSGYTVNDVIAVVENKGATEKVAIGKIASIVGTTITVDLWSGDQASMSASPSGGDDFVYNYSSGSIALGSISPGQSSVASMVTSIVSTGSGGYNVYSQADQELQNTSAHVITAVADGSVSSGSEEYGASVTGSTAVGSGDQGVTSTQRLIQTSSSPSTTPADRVAMIFKLATSASTPPGSYSQTVYYTLTAKY